MASSMKDDLRYTPSDCFETYPFSPEFQLAVTLEKVGRTYYEYRAQLMVETNEGLTKLYNRFNSPNEDAPAIARLRELHDEMDRAVLNAYGWNEIQPSCEFFVEFEDEDEDDEAASNKKKRYRYRWPDEIRDEVLARLLELNRQRALDEGQVVSDETGVTLDAKVKKTSKRKPKAKHGSTSGLFAMGQEEA